MAIQYREGAPREASDRPDSDFMTRSSAVTSKERDAVLKERHFYHVTPLKNLPSIMATGLDPVHSELSTYRPFLKETSAVLLHVLGIVSCEEYV